MALRTTQTVVEVARGGAPKLRPTQFVVEVARSTANGPLRLRCEQVVVEVARSNDPEPEAGTGGMQRLNVAAGLGIGMR